jgi:hypothetical protein
MKKLALIIILSLFAGVAHSAEIGVLVGSQHFKRKDNGDDYNEANPGIYGIYKHAFAGVFKNSYDDTTFIAGYYAEYRFNPFVKVSIGAGASYGYGWDVEKNVPDDASQFGGKRVLPYVLPSISIGYGGVNINTHLLVDAFAWSVSYEW